MANATPLMRAAAWMAGTLACFAGLALSIRELAAHMGLFEILFFRSLVGIAAAALAARLWGGGWDTLRTHQFRAQLFRNAAHYAGQWSWAFGLTLLPLATVFALEFTMPAWAALLAVFFLGERMDQGRIVSLILGFIGILVVVRPGMEAVAPAAFIVLGAAMAFAAAHVTTKRLTRTDSPYAVLFWMSVLQAPIGLVPTIATWVTPQADHILPLLAIGLLAAGAHFCLTSALRLVDATVVIPLDFLRLPLIAVVGFAFYAEPFDPYVLGGGALIFLGSLYGLRFEARRAAGTA